MSGEMTSGRSGCFTYACPMARNRSSRSMIVVGSNRRPAAPPWVRRILYYRSQQPA
jgi:hypothetical protein